MGTGPRLTAGEVSRRSHKREQTVVWGSQRAKSFTGDVGLHLTHSAPPAPRAFPRRGWLHLQFGFKRQCKVKSLPCQSRRERRLCRARGGLPCLAHCAHPAGQSHSCTRKQAACRWALLGEKLHPEHRQQHERSTL